MVSLVRRPFCARALSFLPSLGSLSWLNFAYSTVFFTREACFKVRGQSSSSRSSATLSPSTRSKPLSLEKSWNIWAVYVLYRFVGTIELAAQPQHPKNGAFMSPSPLPPLALAPRKGAPRPPPRPRLPARFARPPRNFRSSNENTRNRSRERKAAAGNPRLGVPEEFRAARARAHARRAWGWAVVGERGSGGSEGYLD